MRLTLIKGTLIGANVFQLSFNLRKIDPTSPMARSEICRKSLDSRQIKALWVIVCDSLLIRMQFRITVTDK